MRIQGQRCGLDLIKWESATVQHSSVLCTQTISSRCGETFTLIPFGMLLGNRDAVTNAVGYRHPRRRQHRITARERLRSQQLAHAMHQPAANLTETRYVYAYSAFGIHTYRSAEPCLPIALHKEQQVPPNFGVLFCGLYCKGSCVRDKQNLFQVEVVDLGATLPICYNGDLLSCRPLIRVLVNACSMKERCEEESAGPKIDDIDP